MRVHLTALLAAMVGCATTSIPRAPAAFQDGTREERVRQWNETEKHVLSLAETMPAEQYPYRPNQDSSSFGDLMLRIATTNEFLFARVLGRTATFDREHAADKETAVYFLKTSFEFCGEALRNLSEHQLDAEYFVRRGVQMNGRELISLAFQETLYLSGRASVYLELKGLTRPRSHSLLPF